MANYNSNRIYNKKLTDGGANYNSGPFTIIILDNGSGIDDIKDILANIDILDTAISDELISLVATIDILDNSTSSDDAISIINNLNVSDSAIGNELLSIMANLNVSDSGIGNDSDISIAGAFFVIDSNNILHPLGVLVTNDSRFELLPSTRDNTEEIPGRHGELDFGTEFKARPLELHVVTKEGYSPLEKSHLQRLFANYLNPTKGYKTLIFSDDVEKTYMVKYSGKIDITNHPTWFQFVLPFKMSNPFIIGSFEKSLIGSGSLINEGTFETGLIIEISGPTTNPTLTIGGKSLSYTGTIPSGQKLIIDTEKQTAKIGSTNAMANYNEAFPLLFPGETSVTAPSNVTIKWRDKWI
ncbi:distal tail protein Dit [Tissierella sp.]|uniref:distal tail protein Dit n=1 Tax=Tissierella sp. TaxID=41274 RepID=UPI002857D26D|nr:distal tail protein Dit [Tissierella sp.]MDR7856067.1 phage tail family protein [Tissierella sp.]